MIAYSALLFSLLTIAHWAWAYQIAFGGSDEIIEIPWETSTNSVDKTDPPCFLLPDEDINDVWVRSSTSLTDRKVPPYIALYGASGIPTDPPCKGDKILHVFAYYDEPGKMQSIKTTLPSYVKLWREIYPDFMPDDPATQLIEGAGLEPGEVLNLNLETMVYIKPNYKVRVYNYDGALALSSNDDYSESSSDDDWDAGDGNRGYDFLLQMSSPRGQ
ncbi:hypothetical protein TWF506_011114 [Arthrobotrys conoides]|uniref:Uncharacterized protein n=1 Tax=Arthrobotrys conoides TaxID=74498 RepID=A0AAN8RMZ8_9PEZI